ncbi:MAG: hypothetical protein KC931_15800, partial [Candidatus Omnitrophica bacterium]|nr:hypothetical protein [Candidatus Omnitrophota bacterium]
VPSRGENADRMDGPGFTDFLSIHDRILSGWRVWNETRVYPDWWMRKGGCLQMRAILRQSMQPSMVMA